MRAVIPDGAGRADPGPIRSAAEMLRMTGEPPCLWVPDSLAPLGFRDDKGERLAQAAARSVGASRRGAWERKGAEARSDAACLQREAAVIRILKALVLGWIGKKIYDFTLGAPEPQQRKPAQKREPARRAGD